MRKSLFLLGCCIIGGSAFAQSEPDSIHLVLHENQNGTLRTLDTIVPLSQQQQLFTWMQANGWDAPPPPPPPGKAPMMFQQEIIIDGDSTSDGGGRRVMMMNVDDSAAPGQQRIMMISMEGEAGEEAIPAIPPVPPVPPLPPGAPIPPMPPMPPGQCKMVIVEDGKDPNGNVMIMRQPMPPPPPGDVTMEVTEKDTVINGETRKMIIRTERIILPANAPAPPPPVRGNEKKPMPANGKHELVVYPNPTNSIINVEFDVAAKEKTTLRVVDMNGKVVYTEEISEDQGKHITREINLTGKGKGAYTVEVKSSSKVIAEKIILQ